MSRESLSLITILRHYTEIDRMIMDELQYEYVMFEPLTVGTNENVVVDLTSECYCYTEETLYHTTLFDESYEWIALSK